MSILDKGNIPEPVDARVKNGLLSVDLADGRTISAPIKWFPRLAHGTPAEWAKFELSYEGIHWPDLNEDIPVDALLRGEKSGESKWSIRRWLRYRAKGLKEPVLELPVPAELMKYVRKGQGKRSGRPKRAKSPRKLVKASR